MINIFKNVISLFIEYKEYYFIGVKVTLELSLISLILGTILGCFIAILKTSKNKFCKLISTIYIELVRGTPMMVQIAIVFFGSYSLFNFDLSPFGASIIAVSFNSAAYVAEIIRSGIQSVDKGQVEAAKSLGLTNIQTMQHIVLPQAIRNILPALGNEFVTLIKETSVASTIGATDLMHSSNIVRAASFRALDALVIVAIMYFILTFSCSNIVRTFEKKLNKKETLGGSI